ncbi:DUF58 domain-containing protein [Cellvibrio mixtus]|uniref:DUF58 domain-containing protein n=1 Tax=Cellvibrio mixtus TaxID=39650 RepID=A0A266Q7I7_9GAMM|nr:DUF58 domain-containing protein [Cellvibrio mixtus]OZY85805.1 DUF58 domain-containing protein [Cellvibrio mixtus]
MSDKQDLNPRGAYTELASLLRCRFSAQDLKLFAHRPARSLLSGGERTRFRGRGMDFEEVRLYQPGDDIRSIDWRVTARTQVAHTKIFREERERPVFMVVDQRSPLFFGSTRCFKSVLAAHIAALLGWAALANGDRLGALVFGDYDQRDVRPRRSKHAVLELLHQLQDYNHRLSSPITPAPAALPSGQLPVANSFSEILADARRIAKPGCALSIISDFHDMDESAEQQLFELARHTDITLIHIYDQLERELISNTALTISNGRERMQLAANEKAFQQAYKNQFDRQLALLTTVCKRLRIPLLSYATQDDIQDGLRKAFGRKK